MFIPVVLMFIIASMDVGCGLLNTQAFIRRRDHPVKDPDHNTHLTIYMTVLDYVVQMCIGEGVLVCYYPGVVFLVSNIVIDTPMLGHLRRKLDYRCFSDAYVARWDG